MSSITVIISPAKSLNTSINQNEITSQLPIQTIPYFFNESNIIMNILKILSIAQVKKLTNANDNIAKRTYEEYMNFQFYKTENDYNLNSCTPSSILYDGPAYRKLDILTLNHDEMLSCQSNIRFLSALYGLLKPFDMIQCYRLEMNSKHIPSMYSLYDYWKDNNKIVNYLNNEIELNGILLNCASEEYFKVISLDQLRKDIQVYYSLVLCVYKMGF